MPPGLLMPAAALEVPRVNLGVFCVECADMRLAIRLLDRAIRQRDNGYFCFCEASLLASALHQHNVAKAVNGATATFADGIAVIWLARSLGHRLPGRVPGPSFMLAACEYGVRKGWRHYFYGGSPGTAERLSARLASMFPGLLIAGVHSPPFRQATDTEDARALADIERSGADLVWVGLGSPKQELWCAHHASRMGGVVLLPVGAAFDFHTGNRPWAPAWIRKLGMEWLFRTVTGGWRTFRRNVRCVTSVAWHIVTAALRRSREN